MLGQQGALVARAARPAGRVAAFAFLELHGMPPMVGGLRFVGSGPRKRLRSAAVGADFL
jgi:hypothetical protein